MLSPKTGRWTWGQYCPMIPVADLEPLLDQARAEGTIVYRRSGGSARGRRGTLPKGSRAAGWPATLSRPIAVPLCDGAPAEPNLLSGRVGVSADRWL